MQARVTRCVNQAYQMSNRLGDDLRLAKPKAFYGIKPWCLKIFRKVVPGYLLMNKTCSGTQIVPAFCMHSMQHPPGLGLHPPALGLGRMILGTTAQPGCSRGPEVQSGRPSKWDQWVPLSAAGSLNMHMSS